MTRVEAPSIKDDRRAFQKLGEHLEKDDIEQARAEYERLRNPELGNVLSGFTGDSTSGAFQKLEEHLKKGDIEQARAEHKRLRELGNVLSGFSRDSTSGEA